MEKWFIKSFKQRKTNFMGLLRKRISPEQINEIIQRNWSYKIQVFKTAAKAIGGPKIRVFYLKYGSI